MKSYPSNRTQLRNSSGAITDSPYFCLQCIVVVTIKTENVDLRLSFYSYKSAKTQPAFTGFSALLGYFGFTEIIMHRFSAVFELILFCIFICPRLSIHLTGFYFGPVDSKAYSLKHLWYAMSIIITYMPIASIWYITTAIIHFMCSLHLQ